MEVGHPAWRWVTGLAPPHLTLVTCSSSGYIGSERQAVVVISACYLPPRSLPDYHNIVHQLFL